MRREHADAVRTGSSQPCPDGFCDEPGVRAFVSEVCVANGWPSGHPVMVQKPDGSWCYCVCSSPCAAGWCQNPVVYLKVLNVCLTKGLPPGTHVKVVGPDGGDCYCTCDGTSQGEAEPAHGASPTDAPDPSPSTAADNPTRSE